MEKNNNIRKFEEIYQVNKHLNYLYNNQITASILINRNSKNKEWTVIANGSTPDVEYWVIKGELNADNKLLLARTKAPISLLNALVRKPALCWTRKRGFFRPSFSHLSQKVMPLRNSR
jgi:hypothetical protein